MVFVCVWTSACLAERASASAFLSEWVYALGNAVEVEVEAEVEDVVAAVEDVMQDLDVKEDVKGDVLAAVVVVVVYEEDGYDPPTQRPHHSHCPLHSYWCSDPY